MSASTSHPSSNGCQPHVTNIRANIAIQNTNNCSIQCSSVNGTGQTTTDDGEDQFVSAKDAGEKDSAIDCDTGVTQTAANGEVHPDSSKDTDGKDSDKVHPDSYSKDTDGKDSDRNMGELPHIIQQDDYEFDSSPGGTKLSPDTSKPDSLVAFGDQGNSNNAVPGEDQSDSAKDTDGTVGAISCETGVTDETTADGKDQSDSADDEKDFGKNMRESPPRRAGSIRSREGSV